MQNTRRRAVQSSGVVVLYSSEFGQAGDRLCPFFIYHRFFPRDFHLLNAALCNQRPVNSCREFLTRSPTIYFPFSQFYYYLLLFIILNMCQSQNYWIYPLKNVENNIGIRRHHPVRPCRKFSILNKILFSIQRALRSWLRPIDQMENHRANRRGIRP